VTRMVVVGVGGVIVVTGRVVIVVRMVVIVVRMVVVGAGVIVGAVVVLEGHRVATPIVGTSLDRERAAPPLGERPLPHGAGGRRR
jgi:hypothetical protein